MEREEYNNLIWRIKKSYPCFRLMGQDTKKHNKYLLYAKDGFEAKIGWSHRNADNLIYGLVFEKNYMNLVKFILRI